MARVWLAHGFNVSDKGGATIDRLGPFLTAYSHEPVQFDYGWTGLLMVLLGNRRRARRLAALVRDGDAAIGHSNGCAILHRATWVGAPLRYVAYINPALDVDAVPGPKVKSCDVFYAPDDLAVLAARYLPGVLWGSMGRDGYQGRDPRVRCWNEHALLQRTEVGHSGIFRNPRVLLPVIETGIAAAGLA